MSDHFEMQFDENMLNETVAVLMRIRKMEFPTSAELKSAIMFEAERIAKEYPNSTFSTTGGFCITLTRSLDRRVVHATVTLHPITVTRFLDDGQCRGPRISLLTRFFALFRCNL
jgi:hypothetical protein